MNTAIRPLAAAAALAVGLVGLGSAAYAAEGNIDPSTKGSILIHKYETGSLKPFGTPDGKTAITDKAPVKDVLFTAYKLTNVDLTKQADWGQLPSSIPGDACGDNFATPALTLKGGAAATFDAGKPADAKTDDAGDSKISQLPVGAYLVCETEAPATVTKKAAPFLVTIPFPDNGKSVDSNGDGTVGNDNGSNTTNWLYDVNVYPKNTVVVAPTKDIEVDGTKHGIKAGEQLTFPVTAKVPSIGNEDAFKYFIIRDDFSDSLENAAVKSVKLDGAELAKGTDYVLTGNDPIDVSFTKAGLIKLKAAPNKNVVVTFTAQVKTVPADGNIENTAKLYVDTIPGAPGTPPQTPPENPPTTPENPDDGTPTNKVVSNWGNLKIAKQDVDNQKALAGATFKVYNATEATAYGDDCSVAVKDGDAIALDGKTEFTTAADGTVNLEGLFVDKKKFDANAPGPFVPDHTKRCYVIEEVAAPAGYVLPSGAAALKGVTVNAGVSNTVDITVDNTKQNVPQLPLTGASGRLLMMIGGTSLILLAAGATLVARRRREDA